MLIHTKIVSCTTITLNHKNMKKNKTMDWDGSLDDVNQLTCFLTLYTLARLPQSKQCWTPVHIRDSSINVQRKPQLILGQLLDNHATSSMRTKNPTNAIRAHQWHNRAAHKLSLIPTITIYDGEQLPIVTYVSFKYGQVKLISRNHCSSQQAQNTKTTLSIVISSS